MMTELPLLDSAVLPPGVRARFVENVNGLRMNVLEAGFEKPRHPCLLLLHGFPELAYSWRKVMGPLAAAGFHVVAPDQRGYGRTTGWDPSYDGDVASFRLFNLVRDALGLVAALGYRSVAAVIGHDFGSPVAALRAAAAGRVSRRGDDERAVSRPAFAQRRRAVRGKHPRRARQARPAAQALSMVLLDSRGERRHARLPARHPRFPARLLPLQERRLGGKQTAPAQIFERRRAGADADLLHHGFAPGHLKAKDGRLPCTLLSDFSSGMSLLT